MNKPNIENVSHFLNVYLLNTLLGPAFFNKNHVFIIIFKRKLLAPPAHRPMNARVT